MEVMPKILTYIDDSPDDLFLFQSACRLARVSLQPLLIEGGAEALLYFERRGEYADKTKFPDADMVLLDLKMPKIDGFEILQRLCSNGHLPHCPIALLSSSNLPEDIQRARELGATWYFVKPSDMHRLMDLILLLDDCLADPSTCETGAGRLSKFS
jgi:CheY-like chemotaxis protein